MATSGNTLTPTDENIAFRDLIERVDDHAIFLLDTSGHILTWNPAAERMTGWPVDAILGRHLSVLYPEPDRSGGHAESCIRDAIDRGLHREEGERLRLDGTRFWASSELTTLHRDDGSLLGFAAIVRDISQRQEQDDRTLAHVRELERVNEALRRSEDRLRLLLENATEYALIGIGSDGTVTTWNPGAKRMLGYRDDEIIGRTSDVFFTPEDQAAGVPMRERAEAELNGMAPDVREHVRADGERFFATGALFALRDQRGDLIGFSKVIRDESERRAMADHAQQLDDRLADEHRLYLATLQQMPVGVALADAPSGRLLFHNNEAIRLLRHQLRESNDIYGYHRYGAEHADGTPYRPEEYPIARALMGEVVHEEEMHYRRGDGTHTLFLVSARPIHDQHGRINRVVSTFTDISWRKQESEALIQVNRELEQFAYVASHDLQEPLRMVTSFLALLKRRYHGRLDAHADRYITMAVDGAERMHRMISHLLEYARIDNADPINESVDTAAAVDQAVRDLIRRITETGAEVTHGPLPLVRGNGDQINRLFLNLIGNALKYHHPDRPPRVHVEAIRSDGRWRFTVRDNGIGIPAQERERIFEPFTRLHSHGHVPGTGIGLSICRKIVERHHGRIWVESTEGEGSSFLVELPIDDVSG